MSEIGQKERTTQNRVVALFQKQRDYGDYGDRRKSKICSAVLLYRSPSHGRPTP